MLTGKLHDQLGEGLHLNALATRQAKLCARLVKFDGLHLVQTLSGLSTIPENQVATYRIEALIHLAVAFCRGTQIPSDAQIREWLNDDLLQDPLGLGEDPVEDVFATVVPAWGGGVVLLEGSWIDNGYYLQNLLAALLRLPDEEWAQAAYHHVMAILQIARGVSERTGVKRYSKCASRPGKKVTVSPGTAEATRSAARFSVQDLENLRIHAWQIAPFVLADNERDVIRSDVLGHSVLERYPLLRQGNDWLLALPTAIGAAARRFILEFAQSENALPRLEAALRAVELQDVRTFFASNLGFSNRISDDDLEQLNSRTTLIRTTFGDGCHAVIVHIGDDLTETLQTGLLGVSEVGEGVMESVRDAETELASRPNYRHGLTLFVHGGVGRGSARDAASSPASWHHVDLSLSDGLRMSWDGDFTAKRIWKILEQQEKLHSRGWQIENPYGFINLYGYLQERNFEVVPVELPLSGIATLDGGYAGLARHRIRTESDYHLTIGPDGRSLIEVQRRSTSSYFKEVSQLPIFVSPMDALQDKLRVVVETEQRPWWIDQEFGPFGNRALTLNIWDAAQKWLLRLAPLLEHELTTLPAGPVAMELLFSDLEDLSQLAPIAADQLARPNVTVSSGVIRIDSRIASLCGYIHETNIAERYLIAAMALGASQLAGLPRSVDWADELAVRIAGIKDARFAHAIPAGDPEQMIQAALPLPTPLYQSDEDRAWSDLGLATLAGATGRGIVEQGNVKSLLHAAVIRLWDRIRARLATIDRRSLVVKAVVNHEAIDRDRAEWGQTAAALLALHKDQGDVLSTHNEQEGKRASAGVASRAMAEMALCTCPTEGGISCTEIDFDQLLAEVCTLIDCATQSDAYYYGLATGPLRITPSGCFLFDKGFYDQLHKPYTHAHGDRAFRDAAAGYADSFDKPEPDARSPTAPVLDPDLIAGVRAEFGMGLAELIELSHSVAEMALGNGDILVSMTRTEFRGLLADLGTDVDVDRAYVSLTLRPRPQWDELKPEGARPRDWEPWRMNRKLSLTRRPFVQLSDGEDPEILISSVLLLRVVRRYFEVIEGRLGAELFDTKEIGKWIGKVVDQRGHAFNHSVAARLTELGLTALPDQLMTQFHGKKELGDVDVLAWNKEGDVWIIECKRLLLDRTVGEVGERLADYTTTGMRNGKRTPIQKHLDRISFFKNDPGVLTKLTGIAPAKIRLRSALVTSGIVPMQFAKAMSQLVNIATDYRSMGAAGFTPSGCAELP
ncbi:hypothetical protein V7798_00755 [Rhizobium laguerreae]